MYHQTYKHYLSWINSIFVFLSEYRFLFAILSFCCTVHRFIVLIWASTKSRHTGYCLTTDRHILLVRAKQFYSTYRANNILFHWFDQAPSISYTYARTSFYSTCLTTRNLLHLPHPATFCLSILTRLPPLPRPPPIRLYIVLRRVIKDNSDRVVCPRTIDPILLANAETSYY